MVKTAFRLYIVGEIEKKVDEVLKLSAHFMVPSLVIKWQVLAT
jgi:hypothetical protein